MYFFIPSVKEIASASGVSEGETISVLKDFRTLLRKTLLGGRSVNIAGLEMCIRDRSYTYLNNVPNE